MSRASEAPRAVGRSGRTAVAVICCGQAFALLLLAGSWPSYDLPWLVLGSWLLLGAAACAAVAVAVRAGGRMGPLPAAWVAAAIALADVLAPLLAPAEGRLGQAAWNWGAGGIALLVLGVFRPAREVLALTALHAGAAPVWAAVPGGAPADPVTLVLVVCTSALPPLAAVQFVGHYLAVLRRREDAVRQRLEARAQLAAADAVQRDGQDRLSGLRAEALPLLREVADGAPLPLPPARAADARRVAERLRAELVEGREVDWLLRAGLAAGPGTPVEVVTGLGASRLLGDDDRAALVALAGLLRRHPGWERMTLALAGAPGSEPQAGRPAAGSVRVALVARGPAVPAALADHAVVAAVAGLSATCTPDDHETLVVEAVLDARPDARPAARPEPGAVP